MKTHATALDAAEVLPPFLSSPQVAQLLAVHPATLRQWRHQKRGPAYTKVGGAVRYRATDLQRWLEERTTNPDH